jgi:uncharacterized membrane protein YdjX (TVP38/TMEM64 family)
VEVPSLKPGGSNYAVRRFAKPVSLVAVALLFLVGMRFFDLAGWARQALNWMRGLGTLGPLALIGLYIVSCLTFFPGVLLTLGAGILYGLFWGSVYVMIGATLGAAAAFLVARYAARDWIKARIGNHPKFKAIDRAISREGWKIVGLIRLSPVLPFILLNFLFGLTGVSFLQFFVATFFGISPAIIVFVYIGTVLGDLTKLGTPLQNGPWARSLAIGGIAITIVISFLVTRVARRALANRMQVNAKDRE